MVVSFVTSWLTLQYGRTPLLWACEKSLGDVAQILIKKGATVDVVDEVCFYVKQYLYQKCRKVLEIYVFSLQRIDTLLFFGPVIINSVM